MTEKMENDGGQFPWRIAGWPVAVLLLLLPLVAMQFTDEGNCRRKLCTS